MECFKKQITKLEIAATIRGGVASARTTKDMAKDMVMKEMNESITKLQRTWLQREKRMKRPLTNFTPAEKTLNPRSRETLTSHERVQS